VLSHAVNGRDIGFGRGFSRGLAKKEAAERALKFLNSVPVESLLS
jgi:dsRNA-specific ribonuclease